MAKRPKKYSITLIEGDGIGPEICAEMLKVAQALPVQFEFIPAVAGMKALDSHNTVLPEATLRQIKKSCIAIKGPLTTPVGRGFSSVNVALRKKLKLFANLRPVKSIPGLSPFSNIDLVIVRENTEDLYAGIEHEIAPGVVESIKVITKLASTRIADFAFQFAREKKRHLVTAIHKANIMKLSDGLFLRCAEKVSQKYPDIEFNDLIVDNACMQLVTRPERFDMLLLENLYGDIVSDLCAGLVGGLGVVPGANIGKNYAVFEAVHGSAPDIAGKGIANPCAMILSFAMMLRYLGEEKYATQVEQAVFAILRHKKNRTPDLGGTLSCSQLGDAIVREIQNGL